MKRFSIRQLGFTLLELLVVISIIGILIAIGAASYSTAQKTSRDARRRADVKQLQSAIEQYHADNNTYVGACINANIDDYIQGGIPNDPKTNVDIDCNIPDPDSGLAESYCVSATLEKITGGNCNASCADTANGPVFCVKNLQ